MCHFFFFTGVFLLSFTLYENPPDRIFSYFVLCSLTILIVDNFIIWIDVVQDKHPDFCGESFVRFRNGFKSVFIGCLLLLMVYDSNAIWGLAFVFVIGLKRRTLQIWPFLILIGVFYFKFESKEILLLVLILANSLLRDVPFYIALLVSNIIVYTLKSIFT